MDKRILYLVMAVFLLAALFLFVKSKTSTPTPTSVTTTQEASSSPQIATSENTFEIVIKGKKLVTGPETVQVKKGESVTIRVTNDEAEKFHIHGYDKSIDLTRNVPAELQFIADKTGRFEFELENSKTEIGALEVSPE